MSPELSEFMRDRVEYYFRDVRGFAYDEVRACMAAGWTDLHRSRRRACSASRQFAQTPDFEPIAASFKRIKNILKQASFTDSALVSVSLSNRARSRISTTRCDRTHGQPLESRIGSSAARRSICSSTKCSSTRQTPDIRRNRLALLQIC